MGVAQGVGNRSAYQEGKNLFTTEGAEGTERKKEKGKGWRTERRKRRENSGKRRMSMKALRLVRECKGANGGAVDGGNREGRGKEGCGPDRWGGKAVAADLAESVS